MAFRWNADQALMGDLTRPSCSKLKRCLLSFHPFTIFMMMMTVMLMIMMMVVVMMVTGDDGGWRGGNLSSFYLFMLNWQNWRRSKFLVHLIVFLIRNNKLPSWGQKCGNKKVNIWHRVEIVTFLTIHHSVSLKKKVIQNTKKSWYSKLQFQLMISRWKAVQY